jgi:hypothetical protein
MKGWTVSGKYREFVEAIKRAERYWLAHIDGALFNRSGVLGGSFITAADTLEELEEGEKV